MEGRKQAMKRCVKQAKQDLLEKLGGKFRLETIDFEECVYLDLGKYDIEVSGGKGYKFSVFLWEKSPYVHVIKQFVHIDFDETYKVCKQLESEYGGIKDGKENL